MSQVPLHPSDLDKAVARGIITPAQAQAMAAMLREGPPPLPGTVATPASTPRARFDLTHLLWYAGALIIMSAMGLFSTLAFAAMGGTGLTVTGLAYFLGLGWAGDRLWRKEDTRTPGGLLIAAAIAMVPLIVYGVQEASGNWAGLGKSGEYRSFYTYIKAGWLPMEVATLAVSVLAARRYAFGFIAFPAAMALWFLSMDIAAYLAGKERLDFKLLRQVSLWFGVLSFIAIWIYELRPRKADFAFWIHLVAAVTFWSGLTFQSSSSELGKFLYCLVNTGLLGIALFMGRRVYAVFGVIGIMIYLGHLAAKVFADSMLFPFALSLFGLAIVGLGLWIARNRARLEAAFERIVPPALAALRPPAARS